MPMSQSASSSPTPRSTSRVMMTGLIDPDLRREDCWCGPSHDDWRKTLSYGILPMESCPTDGRVRTVTTFIACRPGFLCGLSGAYAMRPSPALGTEPGAFAAFFGGQWDFGNVPHHARNGN